MATVTDIKTVQELRDQQLPRLDWRIMMKADGLEESDVIALNDYFSHYVPPGPCIMCGATLGGEDEITAWLMGATFTWGIVHGEGFCGRCKYPGRAYHYDVGPIEKLVMILQPHPDEVRAVEAELRRLPEEAE